MNKNGHIVVGLISIFLFYLINKSYHFLEVPIDTPSILILIGIAITYSLMPDIDQDGSVINRYFTIFMISIIIISFIKNQLSYGIIAAVILGIVELINHRTLIHSVVGALVISAPLLYLGFIYFVVGFIAFVSHIIADGDFSIFAEEDWW